MSGYTSGHVALTLGGASFVGFALAAFFCYRGKVVVVTFWGYACAPCRTEAPYLSKWQQQYGDAGLVVLAINAYDEPKEVVTKFAKEKQLEQKFLLTGGSVAREEYGVRFYPTTCFIDRSGTVVAHQEGFDPSWERHEAVIQELLDEESH